MNQPPPFTGTTCTKRNHVVSLDEAGTTRRTMTPDDTRLARCDCGLMMIGNGQAEIRFGLLPHLFPEVSA